MHRLTASFVIDPVAMVFGVQFPSPLLQEKNYPVDKRQSPSSRGIPLPAPYRRRACLGVLYRVTPTNLLSCERQWSVLRIAITDANAVMSSSHGGSLLRDDLRPGGCGATLSARDIQQGDGQEGGRTTV